MTSASGFTDRFHPIALGLVGAFLLCAMDAVAKHLLATNHALMVSFGRYVLGICFAAMVWHHAGRPALTKEIWRAHALRGLMVASSGFCFFWSMSFLPFVEVFTIAFIAPLLVPFIAWALLGERAELRNVLAAFGGFSGLLVSVWGNLGGGDESRYYWGVATALISALSYALSTVLMRKRAEQDGAAILGMMGTLIPAMVLGVPALSVSPIPALADWPAFALMGLLATAGIFALSKAYARAQAQVIIPLDYTALIWAALIGLVFFNETPATQVWIGAGIIIAACLWGSYKKPTPVLP